MQDKDSFLIEQAYLKIRNKQIVQEAQGLRGTSHAPERDERDEQYEFVKRYERGTHDYLHSGGLHTDDNEFRTASGDFDGDHPVDSDFESYMQECMRDAFEELNKNMELRAKLQQVARKMGIEFSPNESVDELYYKLPEDCEPCKQVTKELQEAESEAEQCWAQEADYQSTLRSHHRE